MDEEKKRQVEKTKQAKKIKIKRKTQQTREDPGND